MSLFFWKKKETTRGVAIEIITRIELALNKQSKQIQELSKSIRSLEASREIQNINHLAIKNELNALFVDGQTAPQSRIELGEQHQKIHELTQKVDEFNSTVQNLRTTHSECQDEFSRQFKQFALITETLSRVDNNVQISQIAYLQIQDALHSHLGMNESDLKQRHDELCMQAEKIKRLSKELGKYDKYKKYVVIDEGLKNDCIYNFPANSIGSPYDK